ncbi:MAG: GDYXXLXY domain-containing protein [Acidobacteria bacterium]|nr:GDYXXLXY domain-containing protein [Acidobacteriota bacterium]
MKNNKFRILVSLLIPILCLFLLAVYKHIKANTGSTIILPITGYDPRDLLSGHYLAYRLDITIADGCTENDSDVYLCLEQNEDGSVSGRQIARAEAADYECDVVMKGRCSSFNGFTGGIERFYIPEQHAAYLDDAVRKGKCSLLVKVDKFCNPAIKDMLIDGKSWKEYIKK